MHIKALFESVITLVEGKKQLKDTKKGSLSELKNHTKICSHLCDYLSFSSNQNDFSSSYLLFRIWYLALLLDAFFRSSSSRVLVFKSFLKGMGDTDDLADLIRIKIKILHSTTHTLSVERTIPVLALKREIFYSCGVSPYQHRLLFRGRVLKDDQHLSDYHVEEGHTLYLVEGPPPIPRFSSNTAANSNLGQGTVTYNSYQITARQYDTPSVVIPDSIATLSRRLNRLRRMFAIFGNNDNNLQTSRRSREDWVELVHMTRQLLIGDVAECLSYISMRLVDQVNVTNPSARRLRQRIVVNSGRLLFNLGTSLLALGHATSRISMGDTHDDVGRAVFIPPTGQNRLQSQHSWLQTSIGAGRSMRVISRRRSSRNQQHFDHYIHVSQNADNTSSPQLTTDEELSDTDSEQEMSE